MCAEAMRPLQARELLLEGLPSHGLEGRSQACVQGHGALNGDAAERITVASVQTCSPMVANQGCCCDEVIDELFGYRFTIEEATE